MDDVDAAGLKLGRNFMDGCWIEVVNQLIRLLRGTDTHTSCYKKNIWNYVCCPNDYSSFIKFSRKMKME